jgi:hypothetical protein
MSDFKIRGLRPRIQDAEFAFSGLPRVGLVRVFSSLAWLVLWLRRVRASEGPAWRAKARQYHCISDWSGTILTRIADTATLGYPPVCHPFSSASNSKTLAELA